MEKKRTFIEWLKYLKRKNAKVKNFVKPDVMGELPCVHEYRSGFDGKTSYTWCAKCKERW
jgi:hypothetical protein